MALNLLAECVASAPAPGSDIFSGTLHKLAEALIAKAFDDDDWRPEGRPHASSVCLGEGALEHVFDYLDVRRCLCPAASISLKV